MAFQVLLVNANQMKPAVAPLGLDYLADALAEAGCAVSLLDLCFSEDTQADIIACLRSTAPDLVAVTLRNTDDCFCTGQEFFLPRFRETISHLRSHYSGPIVLGGVGFSVFPEAILEYCGLDLGIVGEGEGALTDLAEAIEQKAEWRAVPGLVYRSDAGFVRNPPRPLDLAALPRRRRAVVDNLRYFREGGQAGFETKRGCAAPCTYCADPVAKGRLVRLLPPAAVADELEALLAQGVDCLHTCDAEFNLPPAHAASVCEEIVRRRLTVTWYAYCAPGPFTSELAGLMRRAGCLGINFGVDSGSEEMLARLGRPFRVEDIRSAAAICRKAGLRTMFDLLLGGPGETPGTLRQSIDLMREVEPDRAGVSLGVRIYPGTAFARHLEAEGISAGDPNIRGTPSPDLLAPVFYLAAALGEDPFGRVAELVGSDSRFFFSGKEQAEVNYNYSDNSVLVDAIRRGYRGAYWDILRRLEEEEAPR